MPRQRITLPQINSAYMHAREVFEGNESFSAAVSQLEATGLKNSTAKDFIAVYRRMRQGVGYTRAISKAATEVFVAEIYRENGISALLMALRSLSAHIDFHPASSANWVVAQKYRDVLPTFDFPDAVNDLSNREYNDVQSDRARREVCVYRRDGKVREKVLQRARGRCEYCGEEGFRMKNGKRYIETHHIIALSCAGRDTTANVIGLCPAHHREAHFGIEAENLEKQFLLALTRSAQRGAAPSRKKITP